MVERSMMLNTADEVGIGMVGLPVGRTGVSLNVRMSGTLTETSGTF